MKRWSVLFLHWRCGRWPGAGGPAADEGAAGEAPSVFAEASAPDAEGGLSAVRQEGQARPLTDEEIQAAYSGRRSVRLVQPGDAALRREGRRP